MLFILSLNSFLNLGRIMKLVSEIVNTRLLHEKSMLQTKKFQPRSDNARL